MESKVSFLKESFAKINIDLTEEQVLKFVFLHDYMMDYNEKVNLTAIKTYEDVVIKHFIDSVSPLTHITIPEKASVIDVGTGAGFPSLPLMIMRPDLKFTLVDSLKKRTDYLEKITNELNLGCTIINARAEELPKHLRERFDYSIARAVAALPVLLEICTPFIKVGGHFIGMKGKEDELPACEKALVALNLKVLKNKAYHLPNSDGRRLVVVAKTAQTSPKYPRNYAQIAKKPL